MFPFVSTMLAFSAFALVLTAVLNKRYSRGIAVAAASLMLAMVAEMLCVSLLAGYAYFAESYPYIGSLLISIGFAVGPAQLILLLMSSVVLLATALSGSPESGKPKAASMLIELFQISAIGLFSSANLFLFFIFWSIGTVSMFLMINVLGSANRVHASVNFIVYELFAGALLLFGIMLVYFHTPLRSFDIQYIISNSGFIDPATQTLVFLLLFIAFVVNMSIFPMHLWLPDSHAEASTQGSMLLSGIFTQFGAFGMLLLFMMMPVSSKYASFVAVLATVSAVYSSLVLLSQNDIKRIVAYSAMAEMGIILLGISSASSIGTYGALFMMFSEGLAAALMFLVAGAIKHIFGERDIRLLKGAVVDAGPTAYAFLAGALAMVGFPLTTGFVGDLLIFLGAVRAFGAYGAIALLAPLLVGAYMYLVISRSMLSAKGHSASVDLVGDAQYLGYALLLSFIFLFGVLPYILLSLLQT
jgi:NADH-quinone oxidoreductase subunit M